MATHTGLFLDGVEVEPRRLSLLVELAIAELNSVPLSSPKGVGHGHGGPLAAIVAFLAARRTGVPVFMGTALAPAPAPRPGVILHVDGDLVRCEPVDQGSGTDLPEDTEVVFRTSGSSGNPKQVAHLRRAMEYQTCATVEAVGYDENDGLLVLIPPGHAYGYSLLRVWQDVGTRLFLHSGFVPQAVGRGLLDTRVTSLDGVPSHYAALLRLSRTRKDLTDALARLRVRGCGGDVLPRSVSMPFLDRLDAPIHDGYGLTEAGPNVAINVPDSYRPHTVGRPLPGTRVRVESDEIQVRSPSVIGRYHGSSDEESPLTPDGWLRTGDIGHLDQDGYLVVLGRRKEVIIVHGENIVPHTIEEALGDLPGIDDCAVLGVASGTARGDHVLLFAVPAPGVDLQECGRLIRDRARATLPPRLRPTDVRLVPELPRLPSGKLDRGRLRSLVTALRPDPVGGR